MCYILIDFVNIIKVQALNIRKKQLSPYKFAYI